MTKPNILTVVLLVAVLSTACNTSTLSYLENDIPPCVPVDQSTKDPCAQQEFPHIGFGYAAVSLEEIPAYWELYYSGRHDIPMFQPHIVIRATFLPDTSRCSVYEIRLPDFAASAMSTRGHFLYCFIDVRVNNYLIGIGPAKLTVIGTFSQDGPTVEQRIIDLIRSQLMNAYEGVESVLFLAPSFTTTAEAWLLNEIWDVQELDGTVKVVSPYLEYFEPTPENLAGLIVPLAEFEVTIAEAATTRAARHEGRTGASPGLPMFITDANLLRPYFEQVGVTYETNPPALPPPVPAYSWDCGTAGGWRGSCWEASSGG